jgi:glyoxylase-like metal-dependent hydrolase (beta-lactamase superfamily II)
MTPIVEAFFDSASSTFSYVVYAGEGSACAIIDAVQDYNSNNARTSFALADKMIDYIRQQRLQVEWILETHIHADHLSAASYLKQKLGGTIAASQAINTACDNFIPIFDLDKTDAQPKVHFDYLFCANEEFFIGDLQAKALHVPGHTPADMAYYIEDKVVLVGDTLFAPDLGTARCDFPGGSAKQLFDSIGKILSLPHDTVMYLCHDYPPEYRQHQNQFTVKQQIEHNIHIKRGIDKKHFIALREKRDSQLLLPELLIPSIQANIRAGQLPIANKNGISYIKVPLNVF